VGFQIAIVGCLFASAVALAQPKLSGTVTDTEGGAISNALVRIHWDSAGSTVGLKTNVGVRQDVVLMTDGNGSFSVELPSGFYDVFVSAMAFSPDCRKLRIQQVPQNVRFRLKVDPLVLDELGDTVVGVPARR
jgi:hypothetical protein